MGLAKQVSEYPRQAVPARTEANVAAGSAADSTINYYTDMRDFDSCSAQQEWTAGAGGGTISTIVYGTTQEAGSEVAASALSYQNITSDFLGSSAWTGDEIMSDSACIGGQFTWLKWAVTVANKDASTAYSLRTNKVKRG